MAWAEAGRVPDALVRAGIRHLCRRRLADIGADRDDLADQRTERFARQMSASPIALVPDLANEQHYEVPSAFFDLVLGTHRKYSCACWDEGITHLDAAEARALEVTCERAALSDGMDILDLGCGWGTLSLWMAERYPASRILAVSNSAPQRRHIEAEAARRGLGNLQVVTADMNHFQPERRFDRVVSVEMFEHMRNQARLMERIAGWLRPGGQCFIHVFCHRSTPYAFEDNGPGDWMSRHFFSGGIMPSADLLPRFQQHLKLRRRWSWSGRHYQRTSNAWLANLDARREQVRDVLVPVYGADQVERWIGRWRIFFMACAELFGMNDGHEWFVSHYRFGRQADSPDRTAAPS
ncbi:class I SAM-dependent methyltransferase [Marinihelvus fidelis]|uniref:Class I SAM-dependent methyltransferase n=1 Tax=Marinihelvus fidelis TaxID=2613842 RepID=A0A5N0TLM9_9GAMM|nr:cyclopropane-fatty-acyl-phospholipid synthase family protein [Marinihelvus fidelis]KAA9134239.1 class I SAM-dependent methyltransferase [Marinihelvus fidelis]